MFTKFLQNTQNYDLILIPGDFNFPELTWNSTLVAPRPVSAHSVEFRELTLDLAIDSHKFSRKMRESIEIEKHNTIDQEGKPLDSTWRALFNVQN